MAQVQLDNYSGSKHKETSQDSLTELEETSQDSLTELDESRPPDPSLILSPQKAIETRATDPSLNAITFFVNEGNSKMDLSSLHAMGARRWLIHICQQ